MTTPDPTSRPIAAKQTVAFLALYLVLLFVPSILGDVLALDPVARGWIGVARYAVLAAVGVVLLRDAFTRSARLTRERPWRTVLWALAAILVGDLAPGVPLVVLDALGALPETMANDDAVATFGSSVPPVVFLLTVGLLGPVTEELVFRESLIERTRTLAPRWIALVVSSALFGLLHVRSVEELPLAFVYGSVGLVYGAALLVTRGNLFVPLAGHVVHNTVPALSVFG